MRQRERDRDILETLFPVEDKRKSSLKFLGESTKMWCMAFRNQDVDKGVLIKD